MRGVRSGSRGSPRSCDPARCGAAAIRLPPVTTWPITEINAAFEALREGRVRRQGSHRQSRDLKENDLDKLIITVTVDSSMSYPGNPADAADRGRGDDRRRVRAFGQCGREHRPPSRHPLPRARDAGRRPAAVEDRLRRLAQAHGVHQERVRPDSPVRHRKRAARREDRADGARAGDDVVRVQPPRRVLPARPGVSGERDVRAPSAGRARDVLPGGARSTASRPRSSASTRARTGTWSSSAASVFWTTRSGRRSSSAGRAGPGRRRRTTRCSSWSGTCPEDVNWNLSVMDSATQWKLHAAAIGLGGHVRVGWEDNPVPPRRKPRPLECGSRRGRDRDGAFDRPRGGDAGRGPRDHGHRPNGGAGLADARGGRHRAVRSLLELGPMGRRRRAWDAQPDHAGEALRRARGSAPRALRLDRARSRNPRKPAFAAERGPPDDLRRPRAHRSAGRDPARPARVRGHPYGRARPRVLRRTDLQRADRPPTSSGSEASPSARSMPLATGSSHAASSSTCPRRSASSTSSRATGSRAADLEAAERLAGVRVEAGDAIVVRSGIDRREALHGPGPVEPREGLLPDAVVWIHERQVSVFSGDCIERLPSGYPRVPLPLHQIGLVAMGLMILDSTDVESLRVALPRGGPATTSSSLPRRCACPAVAAAPSTRSRSSDGSLRCLVDVAERRGRRGAGAERRRLRRSRRAARRVRLPRPRSRDPAARPSRGGVARPDFRARARADPAGARLRGLGCDRRDGRDAGRREPGRVPRALPARGTRAATAAGATGSRASPTTCARCRPAV